MKCEICGNKLGTFTALLDDMVLARCKPGDRRGYALVECRICDECADQVRTRLKLLRLLGAR